MSFLDFLFSGVRYFSDNQGESLLQPARNVLVNGGSKARDSDLDAIVVSPGMPTSINEIESEINGTAHNYNPDGWQEADAVKLVLDGSQSITGMVAPSGYGARYVKVLVVEGGDMTLEAGDAGSLEPHRVGASADVVVADGDSVTVAYIFEKWRVV